MTISDDDREAFRQAVQALTHLTGAPSSWIRDAIWVAVDAIATQARLQQHPETSSRYLSRIAEWDHR